MRQNVFPLVGSTLAFVLVGCSSPQFVGRPDLEVVQNDALPAPEITAFDSLGMQQVIGPGDEVEVDVFNLPEASRKVRVDSNGRISLPLAGTIIAANLTTDELTEIVTLRLRDASVRDPQVTINISEAVNRLVTIDGSVRQPGQFPVVHSTSLMRTIALGGGLTEFAQENYVVVFRRVGDQDMAALYDLRAIRQGIYPDPTIYANDIVVVGDSRARRVFQQLLTASGVLTAPLVTILQRN